MDSVEPRFKGLPISNGQGDGEQEEDKGAWRSPVSLPPLPSSPSTSGRSSSTSSSSPMMPRPRPSRVVTTPLWKRKSQARMWSSGKTRVAIKRLSMTQSQPQCKKQEENTKTKVNYSKSSSSTPTAGMPKSNIPVVTCPGPRVIKGTASIIIKPYNPEQSADISSGPKCGGKNRKE